MQQRYKIILAALAVTAVLITTAGRSSQTEPKTSTQSMFRTEQISENEKTIYMYWPVYFGQAKVPVFSTFTAELYE